MTEPLASRPGRTRRIAEEKILRAAEEVFARTGFAGARIADIALSTGIPKPTILYYFKTKETLYKAVLGRILALWLSETDIIRSEVAPEVALDRYVRAKMTLTAARPAASRIFASELLSGAPHIRDYLQTELRELIATKSRVITRWIEEGRMAQVDPPHLFFTIWAATQTYADFSQQVCAVLGVDHLDTEHQKRAENHVVTLILRGCGLGPAAFATRPCPPEAADTAEVLPHP